MCRKVATRVAEGREVPTSIDVDQVREFLGRPRFFYEEAAAEVDRYPTVATNANRELRANLEALAGMGVGDDDDLGAALSNPDLPSAVRDEEES